MLSKHGYILAISSQLSVAGVIALDFDNGFVQLETCFFPSNMSS